MIPRADIIAHVRRRIAAETTAEGLDGVRLAAEVQGVLDEVQADLLRRRAELQDSFARRTSAGARGKQQ